MKRFFVSAWPYLDAVISLAILVTVILLCNPRIIVATIIILVFVNSLLSLAWFNKQQKSWAAGGIKEKIDEAFAKKLIIEKPTTAFDDIAGYEEAKEEITEIVDFFRDPARFEKLGAKVPRGVLLIGPPGTGKTLMAKAVAGATNSHFIAVSGSEFEECFVGVGASRVRTLFSVARANAPSIIFIDEADIALKRRSNMVVDGGTAENNQTVGEFLNQLCGFKSNEKVILLAATNRPEALDPAAVRPGRLDRKIIMGNPDVKTREAILKIHTRNKPLADDVNLEKVAKATPRFSGADLETVANEAAMMAGRKNKEFISQEFLMEGVARVLMGQKRKNISVSNREIEITAYHEAGHTLVAKFMPEADAPRQVTILGRGPSAGATWFTSEERQFESKRQLLAKLPVSMGGRAGEVIRFGEETSGACGDFKNATDIVKKMVREYGMSKEIGKRVFASNEKFLISDSRSTGDYSEDTQRAIDAEEKKLLDDAYERAIQIITSNRSAFDALAKALIEKETLNEEDINQIVGSVSA